MYISKMDSYQSAKEEIKRAADIAELIGQYVQLKKAGLNLVGLCPFHSEKDPSFTVSTSKQMFHCFGCKKGGDIFDFWMEYHKVSFGQAVKDLAEKYHVTLPQMKMTPTQKREKELKEILCDINRIAAKYFYYTLNKSDKGKPAREYLDGRSIDQNIVDEFRLGYAPVEWDGLVKYLKQEKVDLEKAAQAGLLIPRKNGGYYDRFRGRLIFPISNMRKDIVGFGGRVLDDSLPKYLNTPETVIFHKGELLYGLDIAYQAVRENGRVVIVEGYTDALALRRKGFHEVVATLGTALTRDHIRKLKGYTREAIVVFDSDSAGKGAAIKSLPLFLNEGLTSKIIVLPEGDDPDSYVNRNGLDNFLTLLSEAEHMFDFYLDLKLSSLEEGVDGQFALLKEIAPVLAELHDGSLRSLYIKRLSERSGIDESIISSELKRNGKIPTQGVTDSRLKSMIAVAKAKRIDDFPLLNLLIHSPYAMEKLANSECKVLFSDPVMIQIFDSICRIHEKDKSLPREEILEKLEGDAAKERFREIMLSPPVYPEDSVMQAVEEFDGRIQKIKIKGLIDRAREQGNIKELNRLLKEFNDK